MAKDKKKDEPQQMGVELTDQQQQGIINRFGQDMGMNIIAFLRDGFYPTDEEYPLDLITDITPKERGLLLKLEAEIKLRKQRADLFKTDHQKDLVNRQTPVFVRIDKGFKALSVSLHRRGRREAISEAIGGIMKRVKTGIFGNRKEY